jgi:hypothetical protein
VQVGQDRRVGPPLEQHPYEAEVRAEGVELRRAGAPSGGDQLRLRFREVVLSETDVAPDDVAPVDEVAVVPVVLPDLTGQLKQASCGSGRTTEVRGQVAEAVAEQLEFADETDPMRRAAEAALMELLDDEHPIVRFWSAFGLGKLKTRTALPLLHALTSDDAPVPRWWTVGQEVADAIDWIEGRVPPGRLSTGATDSAADPQNPPRAEDGD